MTTVDILRALCVAKRSGSRKLMSDFLEKKLDAKFCE